MSRYTGYYKKKAEQSTKARAKPVIYSDQEHFVCPDLRYPLDDWLGYITKRWGMDAKEAEEFLGIGSREAYETAVKNCKL